MGRAVCLVTARDFARYFDASAAVLEPKWSGAERRLGPMDRRAGHHDRRFTAMQTRRSQRGDRRRQGSVQ